MMSRAVSRSACVRDTRMTLTPSSAAPPPAEADTLGRSGHQRRAATKLSSMTSASLSSCPDLIQVSGSPRTMSRWMPGSSPGMGRMKASDRRYRLRFPLPRLGTAPASQRIYHATLHHHVHFVRHRLREPHVLARSAIWSRPRPATVGSPRPARAPPMVQDPELGSSISMTFGSLTRARAIASICCSPPDNVWRRDCGAFPQWWEQLHQSGNRPGRGRRSATRMFSTTDRSGKISRPSGTYATPARATRCGGQP